MEGQHESNEFNPYELANVGIYYGFPTKCEDEIASLHFTTSY